MRRKDLIHFIGIYVFMRLWVLLAFGGADVGDIITRLN